MTLPPKLKALAEAAAGTFAEQLAAKAFDNELDFMDGVFWLYTHLTEGAGEPFDELTSQHPLEEWPTEKLQGLTHVGFYVEGRKFEHTQGQAAFAALREERRQITDLWIEQRDVIAQLQAELSQWKFLGDAATTEVVSDRLKVIPVLKAEIERLRADRNKEAATVDHLIRETKSQYAEIERLKRELSEAKGMEQLYRQFIEGKGWVCPK